MIHHIGEIFGDGMRHADAGQFIQWGCNNVVTGGDLAFFIKGLTGKLARAILSCACASVSVCAGSTCARCTDRAARCAITWLHASLLPYDCACKTPASHLTSWVRAGASSIFNFLGESGFFFFFLVCLFVGVSKLATQSYHVLHRGIACCVGQQYAVGSLFGWVH